MNQEDFIQAVTGPAVNQEDAEDMASMFRGGGWAALKRHLDRVYDSADLNLFRLGKGQEYNGYWKGVRSLADDIRKLPEALNKQLETARKGEKDEE